jgi:hypothetical protein
VSILGAYMTISLSECVDIRNVGSSSISNPQVLFTHVDAGGNALGTDVLTIKRDLKAGEGATGICRGFSGNAEPDEYTYMLQAQSGARPAIPTIFYDGKPSRIRVSVIED